MDQAAEANFPDEDEDDDDDPAAEQGGAATIPVKSKLTL